MVEAVPVCEASLARTMEIASGEKPLPPYSSGMISEKNPFSRMKSHTGSGRSCKSWVISHSSTRAHNSSVGPSRKACSASVSFGAGSFVRCRQSGMPENSSPSHQTEPASSAARSVSESLGSSVLRTFSTGALMRSRRRVSTLSRANPANSSQRINSQMIPAPENDVNATRTAPRMAVERRSSTRL